MNPFIAEEVMYEMVKEAAAARSLGSALAEREKQSLLGIPFLGAVPGAVHGRSEALKDFEAGAPDDYSKPGLGTLLVLGPSGMVAGRIAYNMKQKALKKEQAQAEAKKEGSPAGAAARLGLLGLTAGGVAALGAGSYYFGNNQAQRDLKAGVPEGHSKPGVPAAFLSPIPVVAARAGYNQAIEAAKRRREAASEAPQRQASTMPGPA